mmetsp:Transcript_106852/g.228176  ORF Transcript_106852/g.228176 Transcript_106852/m.228176 type:complete len:251 (-) Transcript_106852:270-1022(-)
MDKWRHNYLFLHLRSYARAEELHREGPHRALGEEAGDVDEDVLISPSQLCGCGIASFFDCVEIQHPHHSLNASRKGVEGPCVSSAVVIDDVGDPYSTEDELAIFGHLAHPGLPASISGQRCRRQRVESKCSMLSPGHEATSMEHLQGRYECIHKHRVRLTVLVQYITNRSSCHSNTWLQHCKATHALDELEKVWAIGQVKGEWQSYEEEMALLQTKPIERWLQRGLCLPCHLPRFLTVGLRKQCPVVTQV